MRPIHFALGTVALALTTVAVAVPATGTYSFANPSSTSGRTGWLSTQAGYNATNGTDYGNSITYATAASRSR